jgi:acetylornithine deacetylase/succinyl-diaminopimelate desuccinylase family protein
MTAALRSIHDTVLAQHAEAVRFLARMVMTPSDNPPGDVAGHAAVTADALRALGYSPEVLPVPEDTASAAGMTSCTNLIVRRRFGDGPVIALNAHGDAVPPGNGWTTDPYGAAVVDGRMYGRGVAVSKSDFATYLFALKALEPLADQLAGSVELHFTYDEESGGALGPRWLLAHGHSKPDFAIAAGFAYAITVAHNGCLHLQVTVRGKQAHAAMPHTGRDALQAAVVLLQALYREAGSYPERRSAHPGITSPTLNVGLIQGGVNTNVVPDTVTFRLDRRMIPEEDPAAVEAHLTHLLADAAAAHPGITLDVQRVLLARALTPLPGTQRLVAAVQTHAERILGEAVPTQAVPLYTDARHYCEAGVPVILYGAGPRSLLEANAHDADENLVLRDLRLATEVVACALWELLRR